MSVVSADLMKNNIALIFKATRRFHGLQQTEFSAILGITQGTISKIESATMTTELELWFRFLEAFKINNPFSCYFGGFELPANSFLALEKGKSELAPEYSIQQKEIFQIKHIRPLYEYLQKKQLTPLETFLKEKKIRPEIFSILNHPISLKFIEDFFTFVSSCKIPFDAPGALSFDFHDTFLGNEDKFRNEIGGIYDSWSDLVEPFDIKINSKSGQYRFSLKKRAHVEISKLNNSLQLTKYLASAPYWKLKYLGKTSSSMPVLKFDEKFKEALVSF